jgi:hypothetical protein
MVRESIPRYSIFTSPEGYAEVSLGNVYLDSRRFRNATEQQRARSELIGVANDKQSDIERKLGRPISDKEATRGVEHVERRDYMKVVHDQQRQKAAFAPPPAPPMTEADKFRALIAQHEDEKAKKADPKGWELRKSLQEAEAAEKAQADLQAKMADPKRPAAAKVAADWLLQITFDPAASQEELELAQWLWDYARLGSDWGLFNSEMSRAYGIRNADIAKRNVQSEAEYNRQRAERERLSKPPQI